MREMTSYFTPLSGLEYSTVSEIRNINSVIKETKVHLRYTFQLSNVIGSIYWNAKGDCPNSIDSCRKWCHDHAVDLEESFGKFLTYPTMPSSKYWSYIGDGHYDNADLDEAIHHFHLDHVDFESGGLCPVSHLQSMVDDATVDNLTISDVDYRGLMDFLRYVW